MLKILYILLALYSFIYVDGSALLTRKICRATMEEVDVELESTSISYSLDSNSTVYLNHSLNQVPTDKYCVWQLNKSTTTVKIRFLQFDLQDEASCWDESLSLDYSSKRYEVMKFCGKSYPRELKVDLSISSFLIIFHAEKLHKGSKFSLSIDKDEKRCLGLMELDVGPVPSFLYSPGYPYFYFTYLSCFWQLKNTNPDEEMMLEFQDFHVSRGDTLSIITNSSQTVKTGTLPLFIMTIKEETAWLKFNTDSVKQRRYGFAIKYYSLPKYDIRCNGVSSVSVTSLRRMPKFGKADARSCQWYITTEDPSDVIIIETVTTGYYAGTDLWKIAIYENVNNTTISISGFTMTTVRYYRSATNSVTVALNDDFYRYGTRKRKEFSFKYYSLPKDVFPGGTIIMGNEPFHIYVPEFNHDDNRDIKVSVWTRKFCIQASVMTASRQDSDLKITDYFDFIDGAFEDSGTLTGVCWGPTSSKISGHSRSMIIKRKKTRNMNIGLWLKIEQTESCKGVIINIPLYLISSEYVVTSPGYPEPYIGKLFCQWMVRQEKRDYTKVISLKTNAANTQSSAESCLKINNGSPYAWCMNNKEQYVMDGNNLSIALITSKADSITPAFKLIMSLENKPMGPNCSKGTTLSINTPVRIESPYFGKVYGGAMDCRWKMRAPSKYSKMRLTISELELGSLNRCSDASLDVSYDGLPSPKQYCKSIVKSFDINTFEGELKINFRRKFTSSIIGFKASVIAIHPSEPCNGKKTAQKLPQYFVTNNRNVLSECRYQFTTYDSRSTIVIEVVDYDLGSCYTDWVDVYEGNAVSSNKTLGKLCGTGNKYTYLRNPTYRVTSGNILIVFTSTVSAFRAFKLKYYVQQNNIEGPLLLIAGRTPKYFQSKNYPYAYGSNVKYQWRIDTDNIVGESITIEVNDNFLGYYDSNDKRDSVKVYDGYKSSGSTLLGEFFESETPIYKSTGTSLFVELDSVVKDGYSRKRLRVKYYLTRKPQDESQSSGTNPTVGVVASITVAVVVCVIIGICVMCCVYKKRKSTSRSPNNNNGHLNVAFVSTPVTPTSPVLPPPYMEHTTNLNYPVAYQAPSYDNVRPVPDAPPPAYSELPSYEESKKYELASPHILSQC